jgi:hypothetical protein
MNIKKTLTPTTLQARSRFSGIALLEVEPKRFYYLSDSEALLGRTFVLGQDDVCLSLLDRQGRRLPELFLRPSPEAALAKAVQTAVRMPNRRSILDFLDALTEEVMLGYLRKLHQPNVSSQAKDLYDKVETMRQKAQACLIDDSIRRTQWVRTTPEGRCQFLSLLG